MKSINVTARFAGCLYLLLIPLAALGILYVPSALLVPGDAATTAINIVAHESLFRIGILSALILQLVYIFLVLSFYALLKSVNTFAAALMVILVLVAVPIAMLNEVNRFAVLQILNTADGGSAFAVGQELAMMSLFLQLHDFGIVIAQIFWGLWLLPLGYLIYRSGYIPRFLGVLMIVACIGYLTDAVFAVVVPNLGVSISRFTFLGEVLLPLWLLAKGVNVEMWEQWNVASAST